MFPYKITKFRYFLFILALIVVASFYLLINAPSSIVTAQPFSISKGESLKSISLNLKQNDFIYSDFLFQFYVKFNGQATAIKAGYYFIPGRSSIRTITKLITDNQVDHDGNFLIKEGDTLQDIENNLHSKNILTNNQTLANFKIKDFNQNYPMLFQGAPLENSLEGFLFPDSYHLPQGLTEKEIIDIFLTNFSQKISTEKILELNNGHSFYENLIVASLLEKEVKTEVDKRMVADIIWRRIKENIPLQVDASICYAQNKSFENCQLGERAFKIDSPYNTYLYRGLPPTPIDNPGAESLKAAFNPLTNDYWYYLTNRKTGETIFSKTLEEHETARRKYL